MDAEDGEALVAVTPPVYATRQKLLRTASRNYTCVLSVQYFIDIFLSERSYHHGRLCQFPLRQDREIIRIVRQQLSSCLYYHSSIITSNRNIAPFNRSISALRPRYKLDSVVEFWHQEKIVIDKQADLIYSLQACPPLALMERDREWRRKERSGRIPTKEIERARNNLHDNCNFCIKR